MTNAVRIGDITSGHGCFPPRPTITGSQNVLIENIPAHRVGDAVLIHCCGPVCHDGITITGSSKVFINGLQAARIGDMVSCGDMLLTGAKKVVMDVLGASSVSSIQATTINGEVVELPAEYNSANTAAIREIQGQYAVFDESETVADTPTNYPPDTKAPPAKTVPEKETKEVPPATTPTVVSCANITGINYKQYLSPSFTLGDFSIKCIFPHAIQAQGIYTEKQIICNLQGLAQEVVEKINAKYPGVRINSGFRKFTKGKSQHEKGMACDMQWPGISNSEYKNRAIWIRDNLIFDQIIFEHGNSIWIHVSFDRNLAKQRKKITTMYKGNYENGIVLYY